MGKRGGDKEQVVRTKGAEARVGRTQTGTEGWDPQWHQGTRGKHILYQHGGRAFPSPASVAQQELGERRGMKQDRIHEVTREES